MPAPLAHVNDLAPRLTALSDAALVPFLKNVLRDGLGVTPATAFYDASKNASRTLLDVVLHRDLTAGLGHLVMAFPPALYQESWNQALEAAIRYHEPGSDDRVLSVWDVVYPKANAIQSLDPILGLLNLAQDVGKTPQELTLSLHAQMGQALVVAAHDLARTHQHWPGDEPSARQAYQRAVAFAQDLDGRLERVLGMTVDPEYRFLTGVMEAACLVNDRELAQPLVARLPHFPEGPAYLQRFFLHAVNASATAVLPGLLHQAHEMAPAELRAIHPYGLELTRQVKALAKDGTLPYGEPAPAAVVTFLRQHLGLPASPTLAPAPRRARR